MTSSKVTVRSPPAKVAPQRCQMCPGRGGQHGVRGRSIGWGASASLRQALELSFWPRSPKVQSGKRGRAQFRGRVGVVTFRPAPQEAGDVGY